MAAPHVPAMHAGGTPAPAGVSQGGGGVPEEEWPGPRHVRARVPAGYKPDDDLFFNSPSDGCSVVLPHGIKEGDVLQVALPHMEQKIEILNAYFGRDPWNSSFLPLAACGPAFKAHISPYGFFG